ncbi:MAG: type II toxin-antitoxin system MqsR family toxin [Bilophila sp.]
MEKSKPHCPLSRVKVLVEARKVHITTSARNSAAALGLSSQQAYAEVMLLNEKEFYKSMTSYHDSSVWQDVYQHKADVGMLYIKLTIVDDVLIVSFKEL